MWYTAYHLNKNLGNLAKTNEFCTLLFVTKLHNQRLMTHEQYKKNNTLDSFAVHYNCVW